jgi:hypothetical protein
MTSRFGIFPPTLPDRQPNGPGRLGPSGVTVDADSALAWKFDRQPMSATICSTWVPSVLISSSTGSQVLPA